MLLFTSSIGVRPIVRLPTMRRMVGGIFFAEIAKKHELLLVPSDSFGCPGYVRLSYCVATETIERSLPAFRALAAECGL